MILLLVSALFFSAFFRGMEIAFVNSDRLRLELEIKNGLPGSEIIRIFTDHSAQYIYTMLIGNIIAVVIFVLSYTAVFNPVLTESIVSEFMIVLLNILIPALIIIIITAFIVEPVFSSYPNFYLKYLSIPAMIFFLLFYPVGRLLVYISGLFLKLSDQNAGDDPGEDLALRQNDSANLKSMLTDEESSEDQNIEIFRNALDFSNVKLREIMVPRTEIEAVPMNSTVAQLREKFIETRFSRILAYNESIDNITGYYEVKDIFRNPRDIIQYLRKLLVVPETMSAIRLLRRFVSEKKNIALVVDEFGGTSGMVTIEDLLEEIVGDIEDEHDTSDFVEKKIRQDEYVLSGRLEIDYLNEQYQLNLPENDEYETLAGMILYYQGSIPGNNEIIKVGNFVFKILRASTTRIELVNLRIES